MRTRTKRPRAKQVDVWLDEWVVAAIDELGSFFGPTRSKTMKYFLVEALQYSDKRPAPSVQNKFVEAKREKHALVRIPVRIWEQLLAEVGAQVGHLGKNRSEVVRTILTRAVDNQIERRHPSLRATLKRLGLKREPWPWENK